MDRDARRLLGGPSAEAVRAVLDCWAAGCPNRFPDVDPKNDDGCCCCCCWGCWPCWGWPKNDPPSKLLVPGVVLDAGAPNAPTLPAGFAPKRLPPVCVFPKSEEPVVAGCCVLEPKSPPPVFVFMLAPPPKSPPPAFVFVFVVAPPPKSPPVVFVVPPPNRPPPVPVAAGLFCAVCPALPNRLPPVFALFPKIPPVFVFAAPVFGVVEKSDAPVAGAAGAPNRPPPVVFPPCVFVAPKAPPPKTLPPALLPVVFALGFVFVDPNSPPPVLVEGAVVVVLPNNDGWVGWACSGVGLGLAPNMLPPVVLEVFVLVVPNPPKRDMLAWYFFNYREARGLLLAAVNLGFER